MSVRRVVLSLAKCALRCFLRELVTVGLNFILVSSLPGHCELACNPGVPRKGSESLNSSDR